MNGTFIPTGRQSRRMLSTGLRRTLGLAASIGLGLLMVGLVLAANNPASFPPDAEQIGPGESYSGTYTDTHTANGVYRVLRETYVTGTARTLADDPNEFSYRDTFTGVIAFIPYTMPPKADSSTGLLRTSSRPA